MRVRKMIGLLVMLWAVAGPAFAAESWPRATGTDFRMLVWNVSREQFFEQADDFRTALRAIDADLLILDEMPGRRSADDVVAFLQSLDPNDTRPWNVAYGTSGDNQRVVFALRGRLTALAPFKFLPYPPRFVAWMRRFADTPEHRRWINTSLGAGIGSNGVEAQIGTHRLLLAGVDLQCCGDSDDSWEEKRRHVEVREIRTIVDRLWSARSPDAVLVAGDFNAVHGLRPVEIMRGSRHNAARRLQVVQALHANGSDRWTWDGRGTPFPSRPIDFVLHSRELQPLQARVFDAETMTEADRTRMGLRRDQFITQSQHRPVVVDFAWR